MRASHWFQHHTVLPREHYRQQEIQCRIAEENRKKSYYEVIEEENKKSDRNRRWFWITLNIILFMTVPVAGLFLLPITLLNAAFS